MGLKTGSMSSGLKDPDEEGYEFCKALNATGDEILISECRLNLTRASWRFFMAGTRNPVVFFRSTNTSLPTAMASICVCGWYAATFRSTHPEANDRLLAAARRSSLGRSTVTLMPDPASDLSTAGSVS